MKSAKFPLIRSSKQTNDELKYKSLTLILDTSYNPEVHARAWGYMVADYKDLKRGDKVYTHYLTFSDANLLGDDVYTTNYQMIFCAVRDGEIIMINDYNLIEIVEEKQKDSIIIQNKKISTTRGIIKHSGTSQVKAGDEVIFREIGSYKETIEGTEVYVCETQDLLAKVSPTT